MIDGNEIVAAIVQGERETLFTAMRWALKYSSGKYKRKALAKMGHPYSVRASGRPPYGDEAMINVQSGEFYLSWKKDDPKLNGDSIESNLQNTSPYAKKLAGGIKGLTVARPLMDRVIMKATYWRPRNIAKAVKNAIMKMN